MKKKILLMAVVLSVMALAADFVSAGGPAPEKGSTQTAKGQPLIVKGKVDYIKAADRYFVRAENPSTDLMVMNPDPKLLDPLSKSGKAVTVQGRLEGGADLLYIEKIDGKPYRGAPN